MTPGPPTWLRVELGNDHPVDTLTDPISGTTTKVALDPCVSTLLIPYHDDANGNPLYAFPDAHDDSLLPSHMAAALSATSDPSTLRRALIDGQFGHPSGVKGLPGYEAFQAVAHPAGFWNAVCAPGTAPAFVRCTDHPGLEAFIADYFGCAAGAPADVEDRYATQYGSSMYPAGAAPDPLGEVTMLHTSWGRDMQALVQGGFGYLGTVGTATATTGTTLVGSAETGVTHLSNDCAGQWLIVSANASGTGSKVYGLILSNTSGTTPTYTVDQWYNAATPGGAAGTTPNATSFYQVVNGGPSAIFVALTTDSTSPSLGGTAGTQDAPAITTALTSEIATAGGGLIRKIAPIGHSPGAATWTATPVFTANGSDSLPVTVAKAAYCTSIVSKALTYMTLVSPTAVLSASGDSLTTTWSFTMT